LLHVLADLQLARLLDHRLAHSVVQWNSSSCLCMLHRIDCILVF
jgi:hypothetical protein